MLSHWRTEKILRCPILPFTLDNGSKVRIRGKEEECLNREMEPLMKATGRMIWPMEKVGSSTRKVMFTKANGRTTRLMALALIDSMMEHNTQASGKTIATMAKGSKSGQMAPHIAEIMPMAPSMAMGS